MGGVSERMLAQTLRHMEEDGFVERIAYNVVPSHVEYCLTPLGRGWKGRSSGWRTGWNSTLTVFWRSVIKPYGVPLPDGAHLPQAR